MIRTVLYTVAGSTIFALLAAIAMPLSVVSMLDGLNTRFVLFISLDFAVLALSTIFLLLRKNFVLRSILSSIAMLMLLLLGMQANSSIGLPFRLSVTTTNFLLESGEITPVDSALFNGILVTIVALFILAILVEWADKHNVDVLSLILQR